MKYFLVILFLASADLSNAQNLPEGFEFLPEHSTELITYQDSASAAQKFVNEGTANLYQKQLLRSDIGESQKREFLDNINFYRNNLPPALQNIRFAVSTNTASEKRCAEGGYSYVFVNPQYPNIVFVCQKMRDFMQYRSAANIFSFAQILIHEATHLIDYVGECQATETEFSIMKNTRAGIQTTMNRDAYLAECRSNLGSFAGIPKKWGFESNPYAKTGIVSSSSKSHH